jgi:cellobiose-specific phosphotransferase system component IIA
MPEGIQSGEKGDAAQTAIDALEEATGNFDTALDEMDAAKDNIQIASQ